MSNKIGIIAEDISDIKVIKLLAKKLSGKSISSNHHVGKGCGPLKNKTPGWCKSLNTKGCTKILVVHDRDRNCATNLRKSLEEILKCAPQANKVVVIPEEELEAWLLSDTEAIARALKLRSPLDIVHHPETIDSPKEYIRDQVYKISNKKISYVNSVHNELIAKEINVDLITKKCPSFMLFENFFSKK
jgi:hypothetical protein